MTPAEEFRALRLAAGLYQREAAALLGVAAQTVRNWEAGRSRVPAMALEIARQWAADSAKIPTDKADR